MTPRRQFPRWDTLTFVIDKTYDGNRARLADALDISRSTLSNLEAGRRWPTAELTIRLANALGVPPSIIERQVDERQSAVS
jgi:transcriptional regulator with XRE-family HTH domain